MVKLRPLLLVVAAAPLALLATVHVPNTFTNGDLANATEINANFQTVNQNLDDILDVQVPSDDNDFHFVFKNDGAGNWSIESKSHDGVLTLGTTNSNWVQLNFATDFFTAAPSIVVGADNSVAGGNLASASPPSTTNCTVYQKTAANGRIFATISRMGTDRKPTQSIRDLLTP